MKEFINQIDYNDFIEEQKCKEKCNSILNRLRIILE